MDTLRVDRSPRWLLVGFEPSVGKLLYIVKIELSTAWLIDLKNVIKNQL